MNKKGQMSMIFLILLMVIIVIFAVFVDPAKKQTKFIDEFKIDKDKTYLPIENSFSKGNVKGFAGNIFILPEDKNIGNHYEE